MKKTTEKPVVKKITRNEMKKILEENHTKEEAEKMATFADFFKVVMVLQ